MTQNKIILELTDTELSLIIYIMSRCISYDQINPNSESGQKTYDLEKKLREIQNEYNTSKKG